MDEWLAVAAVLAGLLLGLPLIRGLALRAGVSSEVARKAVHVTMGISCTVFPWIFDRPLPVWVLAGLATGALLVLRCVPALRDGIGSALHGVERLSYGEILFAPAVAAVFHLAGGEAMLHVVPIAILALADAAGALAGTRWGKRPYHCGTGIKSIEGSLAFLAVAFICTLVPLIVIGRVETGNALWIAATLAVLAMMAEGISDRGFDNLIIPLGCFFLLSRMLESDTGALVIRFVAAVLLLAIVCWGARWSTLSGSALIGAALLGYACAILGDARFVLPPLAVFVAHLVTSHRHQLTGRMDHRLDAVISLAISCLAWVVAAELEWISRETALAGISFAMAVQLAMVKAVTRAWLGGSPQLPAAILNGWLVAGLPGLVWLWREGGELWVSLAVVVALSPLAALIALRAEAAFPEQPTRLWTIRGSLALATSLPALHFSP